MLSDTYNHWLNGTQMPDDTTESNWIPIEDRNDLGELALRTRKEQVIEVDRYSKNFEEKQKKLESLAAKEKEQIGLEIV